jgi:hypothetical protein
VAVIVVACVPGCEKLLGISDPTPADRVDGGDGDGPPIDSSPPCVTAAMFAPEQGFSIGAVGSALAIGQLDRMPGRDVAIAVGDGVQIMSGNATGIFSLGMKIASPADGLVIDDFDADGDDDFVIWDEAGSSIVAIRQNTSTTPSTYFQAQPLTGPFGSLQGALVGFLDGALVPDVLVKDSLAARAFTARLGTPGTFTREMNAIGDIDPSDVLVALGQLDGQGGEDAAFVTTSGDVKIAFDAPQFNPVAVVAGGARARLVRFGKLDEDAEVDLLVGTAAGGVIYQGRGGTLTPASGTIAAVSGSSMQVIDMNGDGKDDLVLEGRLVYQCAPAMAGGPGVFSQFDELDLAGRLLAADVTGDGKPDLLRLSGGELMVRVQR